MTADWHWDETLFAGSAPYYERGRLPYAPGLAEALAAVLRLDGGGRLLDVGCGPGTVALLCASVFREIVGLDADPDMIEHARRSAAAKGIANATWLHARAESLPAGLGAFDAITFAASFHWMQRERVAETVVRMLTPGGAAIHVDHLGYRTPSEALHDGDGKAPPYPPPPDAAVIALRQRYLGVDKRAGQSVRNSSPGDENAWFRGARLRGPELVIVPDGRVIERTIDQEVAKTLSSSSTAPHLFGQRLADFERDLRRLLADASPSGFFSLRLPDNELKIWRP